MMFILSFFCLRFAWRSWCPKSWGESWYTGWT